MNQLQNPIQNSPLVHVDVGLLADDVGEAAADTLDGGHGEHDLLLAIHVGVEQTQDVLEVLPRDQRLQSQQRQPRVRPIADPWRLSGATKEDRAELLPWRQRLVELGRAGVGFLLSLAAAALRGGL